MPDEASKPDVTRLLRSARGEGRERATGQLVEVLYPELRRLAARLMRRERASHTLEPTAVVHEAFMRLVDQQTISWQDRAHFFGVAARVMRQVLVDHARRRGARKRRAGAERVTLDESLLPRTDPSFDLLALDEVLSRFARIDERRAQVAELRVFGGLTVQEIAQELRISRRTVDGDWAVARMWLARELARSPPV